MIGLTLSMTARGLAILGRFELASSLDLSTIGWNDCPKSVTEGGFA